MQNQTDKIQQIIIDSDFTLPCFGACTQNPTTLSPDHIRYAQCLVHQMNRSNTKLGVSFGGVLGDEMSLSFPWADRRSSTMRVLTFTFLSRRLSEDMCFIAQSYKNGSMM
jgi:hypothetical protein